MKLGYLNFLSNNFLKNEEDAQTLRELEAKNNSIGLDEDQTNWGAVGGGWGYAQGDCVNPDQQSILFDAVFESKKQKIAFYRSMYNYPLVKKAVTMMVDEMCTPNAENEVASFNISKHAVDQFNVTEYDALKKEFDYVMNCVFGQENIHDYLRRWIVDGEQFMENCASDAGDRLVGVKLLPAYCSLVIYEEGVATGYIQDPRMIDLNSTGEIKRFTTDQVSYSDYGQWGVNRNDVRGHLDAAVRPLNQLRAIEDALTVTRINRAPERRLWNVYIGRANDAKANAMVNDVRNKYRKTMTIDPDTGMITSSKNFQSFTEDIFVGKTDTGNGTTVEPIKSSTEFNGQMDDVRMFQQMVMDALLTPSSRWLSGEGGNAQYATAPEQEISEITYQKMCRRLGQRYCNQIIKHTFLVHLKLAGFKKKFLDPTLYNITLNGANNFEKIRQLAVWEKMGGIIGQLQGMLPTLANSKPDSEEPKPLFSRQYLYENVLHMSDADILKNQECIRQEQEALLEDAKAREDEAAPEDKPEDMEGDDTDVDF